MDIVGKVLLVIMLSFMAMPFLVAVIAEPLMLIPLAVIVVLVIAMFGDTKSHRTTIIGGMRRDD